MSLSEERQRGSLDVLMATPLSTRAIVFAKWLSVFRIVPWLVAGPALIGLALAISPTLRSRHGFDEAPMALSDRLSAGGLLAFTLLAHGAAMTSLGLCLATWVHRQGKVVGMNVSVFVFIACAWPLVIWIGSSHATERTVHALGPAEPDRYRGPDRGRPRGPHLPLPNAARQHRRLRWRGAARSPIPAGSKHQDVRPPHGEDARAPSSPGAGGLPVDWPRTRREGARGAGGRQDGAGRPPSFS